AAPRTGSRERTCNENSHFAGAAGSARRAGSRRRRFAATRARARRAAGRRRLIEGKFDVIVSGYTADPSITGFDWSDSYLDYGLCLVVRKGSPIRGIEDLRDK